MGAMPNTFLLVSLVAWAVAGAEGDSDWQGRVEAEGDWGWGAQGD